jgi:hypothetical protein
MTKSVEVEHLPETPARRYRLRWFALEFHGTTWEAYLVDTGTLAAAYGSPAEGMTDTSSGVILIDGSLSAARRKTTFIHELIHACLAAPGSPSMMVKLFGAKLDEREELLATYLAPILSAALGRMLRLPRAPKVPR